MSGSDASIPHSLLLRARVKMYSTAEEIVLLPRTRTAHYVVSRPHWGGDVHIARYPRMCVRVRIVRRHAVHCTRHLGTRLRLIDVARFAYLTLELRSTFKARWVALKSSISSFISNSFTINSRALLVSLTRSIIQVFAHLQPHKPNMKLSLLLVGLAASTSVSAFAFPWAAHKPVPTKTGYAYGPTPTPTPSGSPGKPDGDQPKPEHKQCVKMCLKEAPQKCAPGYVSSEPGDWE